VRVEEGGRGVRGEPAERELWQVPGGLPDFADSGEEGDGTALDAAGGEEQHTGGGRIEPVQIVRDEQQGGACSGPVQQGQHGCADQQIRGGRGGQAQRGAQRGGLIVRQLRQLVEQRRQQPLQSTEGQGDFGLDARAGQYTRAAAGRGNGTPQQRRLPDPGIPLHDQRSAPARTGLGDKPTQCLGFLLPPVEHVGRLPPAGRALVNGG
jgi:hypothetical protein